MSHEAHHHQPVDKPSTSFPSAIWLVLVIVGLFLAAVNFVGAMSSDHESGSGHGAKHKMHQNTTEANHETSHEAATEEHAAPAEGHNEGH